MSLGIRYTINEKAYIKTGTKIDDDYGFPIAISPKDYGNILYITQWWICTVGSSLSPADAVISNATDFGSYTPSGFMYPNGIRYDVGNISSYNNEFGFGGDRRLMAGTEYVLQFYYYVTDSSGNNVYGSYAEPMLGGLACSTQDPGGTSPTPLYPNYVSISPPQSSFLVLQFSVPFSSFGDALDFYHSIVYFTTATGGSAEYYLSYANDGVHTEFTYTENMVDSEYIFTLIIGGGRVGYGRVSVGIDIYTESYGIPTTTNVYSSILFRFDTRNRILAKEWNDYVSLFNSVFGSAIPADADVGRKCTIEMLNMPIVYYYNYNGKYCNGLEPLNTVIATSKPSLFTRIVRLDQLMWTYEKMVNDELL